MNDVIAFLRKRQFLDAISDEKLQECAKRPIRFYIGFDPTADSLHLGNLVGIILAGWFQRFGHTPVIILGGATGRIGDPSGKSAERPFLTEEEIVRNVASIGTIFEQILDFSNEETQPIILNNDEWYSTFTFVDFLRKAGKHMRVGPMLAKESVRARLRSEEGMSFTEFSYQVLQAYDFYHLNKERDVLLQLGGSDQWGNITAGIELTRKLSGETVYGLTFPLLVRSDGKKFGKTEEGAVWLSAKKFSPYNFYQYLYNVPDADVTKLMRMLTYMETEEISAIEEEMKSSSYQTNSAQKRLAEELTQLVHGEEGLATARKVTDAAAPGAQAVLDLDSLEAIAQDMPHAELSKDQVVDRSFAEVATMIKLASSKGEANRLVKGGGAYLNNQRITNPAHILTHEDLIGGRLLLFGAGKKKKILVKITL